MKKFLLFGLLMMMCVVLHADEIPLFQGENPPIGDENNDRSFITSPTASIDYRELTVFTGSVPADIVIKDSNMSSVMSEYVETNPMAVLNLSLLPSGQYYLYLYIGEDYWSGTFYLY